MKVGDRVKPKRFWVMQSILMGFSYPWMFSKGTVKQVCPDKLLTVQFDCGGDDVDIHKTNVRKLWFWER